MAGKEELRLRHLIAGADLDGKIDAELEQWKNAKERLREVGEALIAVSTPVSENLGAETVKSALESFKAVGQKVNDRAADIDQIYVALQHAVTVTRSAQSAVTEMDGDQRDKPEFPPSKPGDDEADEMHDLKVYSGQMNLYNSWVGAREKTSQQHADKVESAWQDAIAVMEQVPDDQTGGPGPGGGGTTSTGPVVPTSSGPATPATPVGPSTGVPPVTTDHPHPPPHVPAPTPTPTPTPAPGPGSAPSPAHLPAPGAVTPGGGTFQPSAPGHPGHVGPGTVPDPYGPGVAAPAGAPAPTGDLAPTAGVTPGSLSGYAVGGVAGAGILGGIQAGLRGVGLSGATAGLRTGGVLGASTRGVGSARGSLGASGRGTTAAGGTASGRGTGSRGSRGAAGRRGAGGAGGAASGRGKDKDKKKRQPPVVELFDEDSDWVDDEGASNGVID